MRNRIEAMFKRAGGLISLTFLMIIGSKGMAQSPYALSHLNVTDGLSNNYVLDVECDERGLVWIATESGLNRFDGYEFVNYRSVNSGLPYDALQALYYDEEENKLRLKEFINSIIQLYENTVKTNQAVASEIQELEEKHNQELKEAGLFKLWRNRQDYKINIPTSKLKEPSHELEDLKLLDVDLATSKVLRQPEFNQVNINKSKLKEIDFRQLYIKTGKQDD